MEAEPVLARVLGEAGETVKRSATRQVTRHRIGDRTFYLKRYLHHSSLIEPVKYWFKPPASRTEWELAPRLERLGIFIVPHLAHGELWKWRGLVKSALLTEGPPGFAPLTASISSPSTQQALGRFLRQLHQCAIFHNDLHISNLLYSEERKEFCLVDLDNIHIFSKLTLEDRLNNLATLNRRFPLQREFLEAYDPEFLRYRNKIERRTLRRIRESIPLKLKYLFQTVKYATKHILIFLQRVEDDELRTDGIMSNIALKLQRFDSDAVH